MHVFADYDGKARRRSRQARRIVRGTAVALRRGRPRLVRSFWWDGHPNFGDELTPWLLPRYGWVPVLRPADEAQIVGVGSILEMVPQDFRGRIWGSGLMHDAPRTFPFADVLAVRGELTRERIAAAPTAALGDPGLLISKHMHIPRKSARLAVVPHGAHMSNPAFRALASRCPPDTIWVDTRRRPWDVARQIASAEFVISSSLHGLIFADAFDIPAVRVCPDVELMGGNFKFTDYETVVRPLHHRWHPLGVDTSLEELIGAASRVDQSSVARAVKDLERAISTLQITGRSRR